MPLVSVPPSRAHKISPGPNGGNSRSTILPCTLALVSVEEVLANAFCNTAIMIRPGARNWTKLSKLPSGIRSPTATANTIINKVAVITGPNNVCTGTFKNRITSFTYSVDSPCPIHPANHNWSNHHGARITCIFLFCRHTGCVFLIIED